MKAYKKYVLVVLAILICVSLFLILRSQKTAIRDYPAIESDGTLRIVTDYNSIGYFVDGDTISGFNSDLIRLLGKYTSLNLQIDLETSLDKSILGLKEQKYDLMIRNIPKTTDLNEALTFTDPITQNRLVLVQRKPQFNDSIALITSLLDLAQKTVYIPHQSPAALRIKNLSGEIGDTIYCVEDPLYAAEQLAMRVSAKEIDYAVCDEKVAKNMQKSLPEIDCSTLIGFTHFEVWAVRGTSPALLDSLNVWIGKMKQTPEYQRIYDKYYR